ncbi:MAG TPA: ABC transporter substrate-binding protein [Flavobacteriales bacterium]|nr:ABC transporter substrate-binding protein [Flavobacteriales bacterium]
MTRIFILLSCLIFALPGCKSPEENHIDNDTAFEEITLLNASAFSIQKRANSYLIKTFHPEHPEQIIQEIRIGEHCKNSTENLCFNQPISRVAVLSTTYLGYISSLDMTTAIRCVTNADLIYSPEIQERVADGLIINLGNEKALNMERLIVSDVDLVFYYDFGPGTAAMIDRLEKMGIRVVKVYEYLEKDPLGKAEWIKFFGALFNKTEEADSIFNEISDEYLKLKKRAGQDALKKTVFTGLPFKGEWHQPGGASFQAAYFSDAGADYLWKEDSSVSGILMDREVIFEKALGADVWLHPNNETTLEGIIDLDVRFEQFKSFQNGQVYNNNKRLNENMGNDYWESGLLNPQLVLKDLIAIFQPGIFPDHELYYYQKLE